MVVLDSTGLPAVDGSQLTGLPSSTDSTKLAILSNLSDLNNAGTARTNLGLGTAATTAASDYATSAQGTKADTATQPLDNISSLTNDSNFIDSSGAPVQSVAGQTGTVTLSNTDISGLGTAATLDSGTSSGNVVVLDSTGLPAVDGSQLTGVTAVASPTRSFNQLSTSAYTLQSSDAGKVLILTDSTGVDVTVPNSLGLGFTCDLIQGGAGPISMVAGSGVTLYGGASGTALDTEGQNCMITLTLENTGVLGYVTGQVAEPAAFSGLTFSNMGGSGFYFDDYMGNASNGQSGSWGSSQYFSNTASSLAGKYKKFTPANNATMQSEVMTALGVSSGTWMSGSYGSGYLYAVAQGYTGNGDGSVSNTQHGDIYAFAGAGGTTVTATTDSGTGLDYVPLIYGIDFTGNGGYGPSWGMTFVYDEGGNAEESYDGQGGWNSSYAPACYFWGSSSSTTQTSFSADGSDGNWYPPSYYSGMFTGDQV